MNKLTETKRQVAVTVQNELGKGSCFPQKLPLTQVETVYQ
jgi:hypothetical protein